jgi:hypothetical protein
MRFTARPRFRQKNTEREMFKVGGKVPHSAFRSVMKGGVSFIPGTTSYPTNVQLSAIPLNGGRIRRHNTNFGNGIHYGNGFFDDIGSWFRKLFSRSNTNQIASNLLKKAVPFVTNLAGEILTDKALHQNPLDTIKKHTFKTVKNLFNSAGKTEETENTGGAIAKKKPTNDRAKAAYKKYLKKKTGGAILTD